MRNRKNNLSILWLCWIGALFAGRVVPASEWIAAIDCGGQRAASADYVMDGSIGGLGGFAEVVSPAIQARGGYVGQLTEVSNLALTSATTAVPEGASIQLGGLAGLDDGSWLVLSGSDMGWGNPVYPVHSIDTGGLVVMSNVYAATTGLVTGVYHGVASVCLLDVGDTDPDNYGSYSGDGIQDGWQVRYFGLGNPDAGATNDVDKDGVDNLSEYVADTDPTLAGSCFRIAAIANQATQNSVSFLTSSNRYYSLEYRDSLLDGIWSNVTGAVAIQGNGGPMVFSYTNTAPTAFYRLRVSL